jgi:hypothetical protein
MIDFSSTIKKKKSGNNYDIVRYEEKKRKLKNFDVIY